MTQPPESPTSFEAFYELRWPQAVRLAHVLTGVDAVSEDLAQDAFARVHTRWFGIDNPDAYLRRSVVNACRSWHRSRTREDARIERVHAGRPTSIGLDVDELLALVDALPYRQRAVLILRYYLDCTEAEIADALECRPGTVKSLSARALEQLRKVIAR
jgi:RNA polymerase sigma-70 factor (sigma-E family)